MSVTERDLRRLDPPDTNRRWDVDALLLYALGVGAGSGDPTAELAFTTENSSGVETQAIPTYGIILCGGGPELLAPAGVRPEDVLLVSETLELFGTVPLSGQVRVEHKVGAVSEHIRGLTVELVNTAVGDNGPLCRTTARTLVLTRDRPRKGGRDVRPAAVPAGAQVWQFSIPLNQALLYRLTAGRNPLHSDPKVSAAAGHRIPILHGRCTSGFVVREIIACLLDGDAGRLKEFTARFVGPVFPGDDLEIAVSDRSDGGDYLVWRAADRDVVLKGNYRTD
ncbi:MaoC/PaaZ C-terminal domain-containing protein [Cumulibacter soli]|uniref:MaoC/PaaZ C-terminal domain-containing protein n=1 Tax=Cumulibacter soli TaxID=2546344 RepID=UPI00141917AF|nr:MaoC/PaaZ C-terminal domain-containing protein [Cumulibacter soli]